MSAARTAGTPAVCKVCAVDTLLNHIAVCQSESSTFFKRIVGHHDCKAEVIISTQVEVFRYRFSEAIPIFFNRLKSVFFPCPIAIKFSPVIGVGLKFVKM